MISGSFASGPPPDSPVDTRKSVGERIRLLWKQSGEQQDDFVRALGVSTVTLSNYMNGKRKPDSEFLLAVKRKLNVCIDWLLTGEGAMRPGEQAEETPVARTPAQTPGVCPRCERLEAKLDRMERQRDELAAENRQLLRENGELKVRCVRMEERQKDSDEVTFRKKGPISSSDLPFDGKKLS